jgi:(p)ppGpp synthase/HD superfamily hydrolase
MIKTPLTTKAFNIARRAHAGQKDKGGMPYVLHVFRVAEEMTTEIETVVALLHDVVEDSNITFEDLIKIGIPNIAVDALKQLTRDKKTDYKDYIENIKQNTLATKVKLADLKHNSDINRIPNPTEYDLKRLAKYKEAIKILEQ